MINAGPRNKVGPPGPEGPQGKRGADGSTWFSGLGIPDVSLGNDGDFYLDEKSGDVFKKISSEWVFILRIKGKDGKNGKDGKDGKHGQNALVSVKGSGEGLPSFTGTIAPGATATIFSKPSAEFKSAKALIDLRSATVTRYYELSMHKTLTGLSDSISSRLGNGQFDIVAIQSSGVIILNVTNNNIDVVSYSVKLIEI